MNKREAEILKLVGLNIRKAREIKGLSQFQLSVDAEIPKSQVGRIERAEINTTLATLSKIANALGINFLDLFEGLE